MHHAQTRLPCAQTDTLPHEPKLLLVCVSCHPGSHCHTDVSFADIRAQTTLPVSHHVQELGQTNFNVRPAMNDSSTLARALAGADLQCSDRYCRGDSSVCGGTVNPTGKNAMVLIAGRDSNTVTVRRAQVNISSLHVDDQWRLLVYHVHYIDIMCVYVCV